MSHTKPVTMGELDRLYFEAETRGMLAAAKLICIRCRRGEPIIQRENGEIRHVGIGRHQPECMAWKIRKEPRLLEFKP